MIREEFTFPSADGKTNIHAVKCLPDDGNPIAILQITHGMVEYIERYHPFAEFLTQNGFMVVGHDHIGHGKSVATKDQWGYFSETDPSDTLVADMHALRVLTQKEYPNKAYFMLGHSMGSYMLRKYLAFHNENLNGAIIMGTGFVPTATTKMGMTLAKIIAEFKGWDYRSEFIAGMAFGKPYKKYDLTGKDAANSWLTKNEEIVKKYYETPECTFTFTLNGYMGLFEAVLFDCQQKNVDLIPKDLPILIVSGADDPVGDVGEGVKKVYTMFKKAGISDLTGKLYKGDRHEILNELDNQQVFKDLMGWMKKRI